MKRLILLFMACCILFAGCNEKEEPTIREEVQALSESIVNGVDVFLDVKGDDTKKDMYKTFLLEEITELTNEMDGMKLSVDELIISTDLLLLDIAVSGTFGATEEDIIERRDGLAEKIGMGARD